MQDFQFQYAKGLSMNCDQIFYLFSNDITAIWIVLA
jgi:hypothetical protein